MEYADLKKALLKTGRQYDFDLIERAYKYAEVKHRGQLRKTGEPYIIHPLNVAILLVDLGLDDAAICAGLLHDVVEDTGTSLEQMTSDFGSEIAQLVDGVTKLGKIPFSDREQEQAENLRKMLLAMSRDIRVMIIKLCDRLHNMRTLASMTPQKQRDKSLETMEVYAPIAHRLGMGSIKEELEDLSLKYLDPIGYEEISNILKDMNSKNVAFFENVTNEIRQKLSENGITECEIQHRVKSVNGIYKKLIVNNRSLEEIYDIYAVRIIVNTVAECYNALGVVHDLYTPIPKRFKDYISTPKANNYQSLHTTVIAHNATAFEIQIRTFQMHHDAEFGIAAHWKYKVGISGHDTLDEKLEWVRNLLEVQKESDDATDILKDIKSDLLPEEVFVFTPKGDVINLPTGATVIDYAYAIHTQVGHRMMGAKVNGRIVPLNYVVNSSEVIEVITGPKDKGPSRDWLSIVQTSAARNKIRAWFKKEKKEENILEGRTILERECRREFNGITPVQFDKICAELAKRQKVKDTDELFAEIGYGGLTTDRIMPKARQEFDKLKKEENADHTAQIVAKAPKIVHAKSVDGVIIEGLDNCLIKFSRCCNPLPGDPIVGFITRGRGVSIHRADCRNVVNAQSTEEGRNRIVKARWDDGITEQFKASIGITCLDRTGLLADISGKLSNLHIPIYAIQTYSTTDRKAVMNLTLGVSGSEHLTATIEKLKKIKGVLEITRYNT